MKKGGRNPKAVNTVDAGPNHRDQEHRETVNTLPSVPLPDNMYSPSLRYFITVQNNHLKRLRCLFPEINPAILNRILDFCQGDFIRTVDRLLCIRSNGFIHGSNRINPSSAGFYRNMTPASHSNTYKHVPSNNNNTTMVQPPFIRPMVQTSHITPSSNQTTSSDYHINQYPGINDSSKLTQTPVFFQGSNISKPSQFIQYSNKFSEPVPCPALPNVLPTQTTSTHQQFTEEFKPELHPPFMYSEMPHPPSHEISGNASNVHVHGQYSMNSPQMVRPNLASAIKQDTECSHLAAHNTSKQPRNSPNQMAHKIKGEVYAKQQEKSWFQQQQQQYDENSFLDFLKNIQPPISHQSHQDADKASVPLPHLPSSYVGVTTPIQTVSTAAHVEFQKGKLEENHSMSSPGYDSALATDVEVTQNTEKMQAFRVTSGENLDKFTAEGSVPLKVENNQCILTGKNRPYYLDETSSSEDGRLIIDTDDE